MQIWMKGAIMNGINDEKDRRIIEEQSVTIRLLTDLTKAGMRLTALWRPYNGAMDSAG